MSTNLFEQLQPFMAKPTLAQRLQDAMKPILESHEREMERHSGMRATLIVNFGKTHGRVMKIVDEDLGDHVMLVKVLEHLVGTYVPVEDNLLKMANAAIQNSQARQK